LISFRSLTNFSMAAFINHLTRLRLPDLFPEQLETRFLVSSIYMITSCGRKCERKMEFARLDRCGLFCLSDESLFRRIQEIWRRRSNLFQSRSGKFGPARPWIACRSLRRQSQRLRHRIFFDIWWSAYGRAPWLISNHRRLQPLDLRRDNLDCE